MENEEKIIQKQPCWIPSIEKNLENLFSDFFINNWYSLQSPHPNNQIRAEKINPPSKLPNRCEGNFRTFN